MIIPAGPTAAMPFRAFRFKVTDRGGEQQEGFECKWQNQDWDDNGDFDRCVISEGTLLPCLSARSGSSSQVGRVSCSRGCRWGCEGQEQE